MSLVLENPFPVELVIPGVSYEKGDRHKERVPTQIILSSEEIKEDIMLRNASDFTCDFLRDKDYREVHDCSGSPDNAKF